MSATINSERCGIAEALAILGGSKRTIQAMAAAGELAAAGAAKMRGHWSFNRQALREFVRERERAACQNAKRHQAAIGAAPFYGRELKSAARTYDSAYTQAMQTLLRGGARRATTS